MKTILLKIALYFGLILIPVIALFIAPYPQQFAYHFIKDDCYNHGAWIFDRITHNPTPIDVAFIGSSHTIHAWQDKKMEEILGGEFRIANLGYCRYGRDMEYLQLRMLLEHKSPKLIVFEVHEDEEKKAHEIFPYLANSRNLIFPPTLINWEYLANLFHGTTARLEYFKSRYIFRKEYPDPSPELYGYGESDRVVSEIELKENREAWTKRLDRKQIQSIEDIQLKYPFAYLNKMIYILKEKNIPFLFVYLPESESKLKSPKYALHYQSLAPLLIPPDSIFEDPTSWMDASHLNDKGSGLISSWMVQQLRMELCTDSAKQK
jgi:hypothetical protein